MAVALCGCGKSSQIEATPVETVMLVDVFERLQAQADAPLSAAEQSAIEAFMAYRGYTAVDSMMMDGRMAMALSSFGPLVHSTFGDTAALTQQVRDINQRAAEEGVTLATHRYAFVVWNDLHSMAFVDSILLVALNHYLGVDCPYYRGFPEYQLWLKTPAQLPLDVAEAQVASAYPYIGKDALSRMVYEGVLAIARQRLTGCSEAESLGYDEQQWTLLQQQSEALWKKLATQKLIYTTDEYAIDQLVMPAPYTLPLGQEAPARIGRYFGMRIVQAWIERHDAKPLAEMLVPEFYANDRILVESGYTGR